MFFVLLTAVLGLFDVGTITSTSVVEMYGNGKLVLVFPFLAVRIHLPRGRHHSLWVFWQLPNCKRAAELFSGFGRFGVLKSISLHNYSLSFHFSKFYLLSKLSRVLFPAQVFSEQRLYVDLPPPGWLWVSSTTVGVKTRNGNILKRFCAGSDFRFYLFRLC